MSDDEAAPSRPSLTPLSVSPPDSDAPTPVVEDLAAADVVGLGEVTHGTRECFQGKACLLRSLVADHGFRTVAFEADAAAVDPLDDYVRTGEGDAESALADLQKWQWQTESVAALLDWLREFNADRPASDRVRVRGVDLSDPSRPAARLLAALDRADVVPVPNDLETLVAAGAPPEDETARERYLARSEAALAAVRKRLDDDREAFVAATSAEAWARARHLCRVAEQNCEWHRVRHEHDGPHESGMAARDRFMAENVGWCRDHDPGAGVAVWAHNSHVQRGTFDDGAVWTDAETMGAHLADEFGDGYRVLGFDAGGGSFRAAVRGEDDGPRVCSFDPPLDGTLTARLDALARADDPGGPFVVDLAAAAAGDLADLLAPDGRIRWVGTVYDPGGDPDHHYQSTDLPASYDHLWFLPESTPTRTL